MPLARRDPAVAFLPVCGARAPHGWARRPERCEWSALLETGAWSKTIRFEKGPLQCAEVTRGEEFQ